MNSKNIGIVGGKGKMGSLFASEFSRKKHKVTIYDLDTKTPIKEFINKVDILIFTVPINQTKKTIEKFSPHLKRDLLITDFTSIKYQICQTLKQSTAKEIAGGHPLFGPSVSLKNQNFILTPIKTGELYKEYKEILKDLGLNIIEMSPEEHDKYMAVIQCLTHLSNITLGYALKKINLNLKKTMEISSPVYLMRIYNTARILAQEPSLYSDIQIDNKFSEEVVQKYLESVSELHKTVQAKNKTKFEEIFIKTRNYFSSYLEESVLKTDKMIKSMIEKDEDSQ